MRVPGCPGVPWNASTASGGARWSRRWPRPGRNRGRSRRRVRRSWTVQAADRRDPARRPGCAAQTAAHGEADLRPADRRARHDRRVVPGGPRLRRSPQTRDPDRGRSRPGRGVRAAVTPARHGGRGRLRRGGRPAARHAGDLRPVLAAAVLLGQGRRTRSSSRVGRRPSSKATSTRSGCSAGCRRADPLRQPQGRGRPGARLRPAAGGNRPLDRVPVTLVGRPVLLPARPGRARTRRAGSRDRSAGSAATTSSRSPRSTRWPSSTPWSEPGTPPTTPAGSAPGRARSGRCSPWRHRCWRRCRSSRSRPAAGSPLGSTGSGQITVRTNRYSVPVRLIGRRVRVLLHASELAVFDGRTEVARHERLLAKAGSRLELDHYLEALIRKPGALPGRDRARAGPRGGQVHPGPRRLVGRGPQGPRRPRRHPRADPGTAAAPAHDPRTRRRRPGRRAPRRRADRGRGRVGSPQGGRHRHHPHPGARPDRPGRGAGDVADPAAARPAAARHPTAPLGGRLRPAAPQPPNNREGTRP